MPQILTLTIPFIVVLFITPLGNLSGLRPEIDTSQEGGWDPGNPDGLEARRIPAKRGSSLRWPGPLAGDLRGAMLGKTTQRTNE